MLHILRHKRPEKASSQAITLVDTFTSSEKQQVPAERPFTYNAFAPVNAHVCRGLLNCSKHYSDDQI